MAGRRPISLGVLAVFALALLCALAPAQASALRIASPANDRFFAQPPVRIKLTTAKSARSVDATLGRKTVSGAFERVRPGLWRASFGARQLKTGANHLVVSARAASGERDYVSARFFVGQRKPGFLSLSGPSRGAPDLVVHVKVAKAPERLSAKLNGKRPRWQLSPWPSRGGTLPLGANDGLHFGTNRLQVFAARRDGVFDVERRELVVPRNRPLVGAGPDRRTTAGSRLRLDGRSTRAALGAGARLSYRWQVVDKPRGSKAKLRHAGAARPLLRTDRPGVYRVRLLATEVGRAASGPVSRSASDVVTLTAVANLRPIGKPIETIAFNGQNTEETADTGIRIGAKTYWMGMPKGNSVQAVILERGTLGFLYAASYPGSATDAETLKEKIKEYGGNKTLVAISNPDLFSNSEVSTAFVPIVKSLGAPVGSIENGRAGWSVVGVPGSKSGAYLGTGANHDPQGAGELRGNLSGYLQENSGKGFGFVPADRPLFDSSVPSSAALPTLGNTIEVGAAKYLSDPLPACATGGFQVEVLLAETLAPAGGGTFATNGCGDADNATGQQQLAALLNGLTLAGGSSEGPKLVFVQSIGSPYDAAAGSWDSIATALERLGGTASVFAAARASYALVGELGIKRLPLTEASETLTGKPARITGMLEPDRRNAYVPVLSSPSGVVPFGLAAIAYQPTQAWPLSESKEERAALEYAAKLLGLEEPAIGKSCYVPTQPDVRSEYCNLRYRNQWSSYAGKLERAKFKSGQGFSKGVWHSVVTELAENEFDTVQSVWNLVTTLQGAFGATGVNAEVNLNKIATEIEQAIAPPKNAEADSWWLELVANVASIVSYYDFGFSDDDEFIEKTSGTLSGALFIAAQSLYSDEGSPIGEEFQLDAEEVAVELSKRYLAASNGLGRIGELLVSDYGKLSAIDKSGLLGINSEGVEEITSVLGPGSRQWTYQALLPITYEAVSLQPGTHNSPLPAKATEFECDYVESGPNGPIRGVYAPFHTAAQAELFSPAPTRSLGVLVKVGSTLPHGEEQEEPRSPPASLLEPLFKSESKGGLGLYAPWFWSSTFEYPAGKIKTARC